MSGILSSQPHIDLPLEFAGQSSILMQDVEAGQSPPPEPGNRIDEPSEVELELDGDSFTRTSKLKSPGKKASGVETFAPVVVVVNFVVVTVVVVAGFSFGVICTGG